MLLQVLVLLLFPALMAFAASSDLLTMTISNRVALALVFAFAFFTRGWIGGGDAKLAAATVLWLGFDHTMTYLIWSSLLGGALTIALLKVREYPLPALLARQDWAVRLHSVDAGIPYGIALAAAALLVYPETSFMHALPF
jgi:prepilin peptidase CpaA